MISLPLTTGWRLPYWSPALRASGKRSLFLAGIASVLLALVVAVAVAQVAGERGIAPVAVSTDIEVGGIRVDARGDTAEAAREEGWKEAQRKAWERIDGPAVSDSQLQSLVSAIVIEQERIGPGRYIATLGVIFDRQRAGRLLGEGTSGPRSAPMLLVPVTVSEGTATTFETRNPWQRAWAEYQAGSSQIDYVRPSGAGSQSLLINYGQVQRRSRYWWRNILDQFGAADVLVPIVRLRHQFPGGPITGEFTARYGPDNRYLADFTMVASGPEELPAMLAQAVRRFNQLFERALARGILTPDPTLDVGQGELDPELARLIELGRRLRAADGAAPAPVPQPTAASATGEQPSAPEPAATINVLTVQFTTPDAAAFDSALRAVRGAPGVESARITSTAIGGTSIMQVSYSGDLAGLADALRERGFTVQQGPSALRIER